MGPSRRTILTASALVLAGATGFVVSEVTNTNQITVGLPDGITTQIRYVRNKAPRLSLQPEPLAVVDFYPDPTSLDDNTPLAAMARLSAAFDHQVALLATQPEPLDWFPDGGSDGPATIGWAKFGVSVQRSYAVMTTLSGDGECSRTLGYTGYTDRGDGKPPHISRSDWGACEEIGGAHAPATTAPSERGHSNLIESDGPSHANLI